MSLSKSIVLAGFALTLGTMTVKSAEIALVPIGSDGAHNIVGNEIILQGAGQRVTLEIQLSGWSPAMLRAFQASLDSAGYTSGIQGELSAANVACGTNDDCAAVLGGTCSLTGDPCFASTDCSFPQFGEICDGPNCTYPPGVGGSCEPAYIDALRPNYVFADTTDLPAMDLSTADFRWASAATGAPVSDPGTSRYGGTLVLDVPAGALGTFTVGFMPVPESLMQDSNSDLIAPLTITPALISIACATAADCDDGNACTDDACNAGQCSATPNYNQTTQCCNPTDGSLTAIDDGNECTTGSCDAGTGAVTQTSRASGAACGDPTSSECNGPDACDGAGNCENNVLPAGTSCGDPADSECDGADTCGADGICQTNFATAGTACGDASATSCTAPDTCDGAGSCQANHSPNGTACDDGLFCTQSDTCSSGACVGAGPTDCDDGLSCTADSCNEAAQQCDHVLNAAACLITDTCYEDGDVNPANDCEACNASSAPNGWSYKAVGAACDDGDACTGTGRIGIGFDACDGAGTCAGLPDPECNDDCDFAVPVVEGVNIGNNDNRAEDDAEASCQLDSNNDVWFVYTASCDGAVFMSTTGSLFVPSNDPVLSVFDACPSVGGVEIACDDDSGVNLQAALTLDAMSGSSYWIRVAGFEQNTGNLVLNIATVNDCLIGGVCYVDGAINPDNECEACIPDLSTSSWSSRPEGSACGNGVDTECDSPDACDGAGVCESNPKPDGTVCSDDGNECTIDVCAAGNCAHPPEPTGTACGDPTDGECNHPDTCDGASVCLDNFEPAGFACGDPTDTQCDHADICDGGGFCGDNLETDGTACDDGDICTGSDACNTGNCIGVPIPEAPIVEGYGPRRILVTPQPAGTPAPVALRLSSPDWPCLDLYVNASGRLSGTPVFQVPDDWGTVMVSDDEIVPDTVYEVTAECGTYASPTGAGQTSLWGDIVGPFEGGVWTAPDGIIDIVDMLAVVEAFEGQPTAPPMELVDLYPCVPDNLIDIMDIVQVVDAFGGDPYPCAVPCP